MYGSLLHVPRRSARLSGTIADSLGISCMCSYGLDTVANCLGVSCRCPSGLRDCLAPSKTSESLLQVLAPSQTVFEYSAGDQTVFAP
ncbi:hypothetical protein DPMN_024319 [Dreissena polymorpha]|uniref:Uncharacterized protein n=1 Tax=Dreissena polymorpha TaxID=45954 RepID=A0A9D4RAN9_DREPO|nr:hypothetical protein DPMN_024319 [Dreissena polymorpha]